MNLLPRWQYSGLIETTDDLGLLEADLHAGRTEAAERGYLKEPESIELDDVMLLDDSRCLTEAEAEQAGLEFRPWGARYVMTWNAENDIPAAPDDLTREPGRVSGRRAR